jgi:glycosyl transferase family 25
MSKDTILIKPTAFDFPVYVIHAAHFVDRKKHITQALAQHGIDFEFVKAFDPKDITAEIEDKYFSSNVELSTGAKSCALKHVHVMEMMRERQQSLALVLEDDLILDDRFVGWVNAFLDEASEFPAGYSIQLGCANNMYVPGRQLKKHKHLYLQKEVRAGEAYLIDAKAANLRLSWITENKISLPIDHLFNRSDRELGLSIYWSDPTLVEQGSMNGLFKTSLDQGRVNKSSFRLRFKFGWQKLRKKYIYRLFRSK